MNVNLFSGTSAKQYPGMKRPSFFSVCIRPGLAAFRHSLLFTVGTSHAYRVLEIRHNGKQAYLNSKRHMPRRCAAGVTRHSRGFVKDIEVVCRTWHAALVSTADGVDSAQSPSA